MDIFRSADTDTFFSYDDVAVEDEFERRLFSDRLARIIMDEKGGKPLVVSIVNPWGGGKSTILQYIRDAIAATTRDESPNVKNCRITSFNLWRYAGEDQLLYRMFESLIQAINRDTPLTTGQTLLRLLPGWVKRFSLVCDWLAPGTGVLLDSVFATISPEQFEVRLDEVRNTTREYLAKTGMRVVMLLDDVDRLDPDEILLLFRALKLIADLPNTTFVIAMDEEHVSQVIGRRIGGGRESGRRYIEKIVTVRLAVPKIPDHVFEDYVLRRFISVWRRETNERAKQAHPSSALDRSEPLVPDPAEIEDMIGIFRVLHLPYVHTPRTVKTIQNAFAFALGLLPDEVDARDVLLLEATRLLHPKLYLALPELLPVLSKFDSRDSNDFIGSVEDMFDDGDVREKSREQTEEIVGRLAHLIEKASPIRKKQIEGALNSWFGLEGKVVRNKRGKRISSPSYFWRYYSGAVHKGDVHDRQVSEWLDSTVNPKRRIEASQELKRHLDKPYRQAFLNKLEELLLTRCCDNDVPLRIIAEVVATFSETVEVTSRRSLWHHAASIIANIIANNSDENKQIEMATFVVKESKSLRWNFVFFDHIATNAFLTFPTKNGEKERLPSQFDEELARQSLNAYEAGFAPSSNALICGMVWSIYRNRHLENFTSRVLEFSRKNPRLGLQFLAAGCTFGESEKHREACWKWNGEKGLQAVEALIPISSLKQILEILPSKSKDNQKTRHDFDYLTLEEVGWECLDSIEARDSGHRTENASG
jgi:hypothetical protein